jgi:hypothetical protein
MPELAEWDSFYVIVGSSAGALIGLQFVVLALIADRPVKGMAEAGAAFVSPTIIHFCAALLLSALVRVPWPSAAAASTVWGLLGLMGIIYVVVVARRMHGQLAIYRPQAEDWLFHIALPLAAYGTLAISAFWALEHLYAALFGIGASALVLLFSGIHNAWDAVAYHVFVASQGQGGKRE